MVLFLCDDTGMRFPWGITFSIHGLQTQEYKKSCCHGICVLRSNLICCLLLCYILRPDQDMEIILIPVKGIEHPTLELKKGGFWPLVQI